MQQLNEQNWLVLKSCQPDANNSEVLICQFEGWPDWQQLETEFKLWLTSSGFTELETVLGADRISWRIEMAGQVFYFHVEELSESAWFEAENIDRSGIQFEDNSQNLRKSFNIWLLQYLKPASL